MLVDQPSLQNLKKIPQKKLLNFLRYINIRNPYDDDEGIISVRHINMHLDNGIGLVKLFTRHDVEGVGEFSIFDTEYNLPKNGYFLKIKKKNKNEYNIGFGWAFMTIGDGGEWSVVFDDEDKVVECERFGRWIC